MRLHLKFILLVLRVDPSNPHIQMIEVIKPQLRIPLDLNQLASIEAFGQIRVVLFCIGGAVLLPQDCLCGKGVSFAALNQGRRLSTATCHKVGPSHRARSVPPVLELRSVTRNRHCDKHRVGTRFRCLHSGLNDFPALVLLCRQSRP